MKAGLGGFLPIPLKLNTLETAEPPEEVSILPIPRELTRPEGPPGAGVLLLEPGVTSPRGGAGDREEVGGGECWDWLDCVDCVDTRRGEGTGALPE